MQQRTAKGLLTLLSVSASFAIAQPPAPGPDAGEDPVFYFPADNNPADFTISEQEFEAFKWAWRLNENWPELDAKIPIDQASLCGTIYFGFEGLYHVVIDGEGNPVFVPGAPPDDGDNSGSSSSTTVIMIGPTPARVIIEIEPPAGAVAYCVEERIPTAWAFHSSSGTFSHADRTVRWGPTPAGFDTLDYEVFSLLGDRFPTQFDGTVSFDGQSRAIDNHQSERQYGNSLSFWPFALETAVPEDQLWAFALFGNTGADYESALPRFTRSIVDGQLTFTTRIQRYKWADDVRFQIEYSTNLLDWYPESGLRYTPLDSNDPDLILTDVSIPCDTAPGEPKFYRVAVLHEPNWE